MKTGVMEILPAWMIEELEKLRREQEAKRPELRIEIPRPSFDRRRDPVEEEVSIVVPMR